MELSLEEYQKLVMDNYTRIWDNFAIAENISKKLADNLDILARKLAKDPENIVLRLDYIQNHNFLNGFTLGLLAVMLGNRKVD